MKFYKINGNFVLLLPCPLAKSLKLKINPTFDVLIYNKPRPKEFKLHFLLFFILFGSIIHFQLLEV